MTKDQLTRIADLQIKILTIDERLEFLKGAMRQLLYENCKVQISFTMVNQDIKQKNDINQEIFTMSGMGGFSSIFHFPPELLSVPKPKIENDKTSFVADFTDGNAVLILNTFFNQEKTLQKQYQQELQQLLSDCMPQAPHDNPILQLHQNKQL